MKLNSQINQNHPLRVLHVADIRIGVETYSRSATVFVNGGGDALIMETLTGGGRS